MTVSNVPRAVVTPCMKLLSPAVIIYYQKNEEAKSKQLADPAPNAASTQQEQVFTSKCLLDAKKQPFLPLCCFLPALGSTQEANTESKDIQPPPEEMAQTGECSVALTGHCWAEE